MRTPARDCLVLAGAGLLTCATSTVELRPARDPGAVASQDLRAHAIELGLCAADIADVGVTSVAVSSHTGMRVK